MLRNRSYTNEQFINAIRNNKSIAGVLRELNLCAFGSTYRAFKILAKKLGVNTEHFTGQGWLRGQKNKFRKKMPLENILIQDSDYSGTSRLKLRLVTEGYLVDICSSCNLNPFWNGKKITLHLDHINGINTDNRIENLRILCPNCHSQTETFAGRNTQKARKAPVPESGLRDRLKPDCSSKEHGSSILPRSTNICACGHQINRKAKRCRPCSYKNSEKIAWPSNEELQKLLWEKSTLTLSKELGVSDKAIEKRAKVNGLTKPPRGYWAKQR